MSLVRFWPPAEVMKMPDENTLILRPLGVFLLGMNLSHLEWVLNTTTNTVQIVTALTPFRSYTTVRHLEDIGDEAVIYHDRLTAIGRDDLSSAEVATIWDIKTRWTTIASTKMEELFLITPSTIINPKNLMSGVPGLLAEHTRSLLEPIEMFDLNEAIQSLLVGSSTASEVMALRTAEHLLRRWYEHASGEPVGRKGWSGLLDWFTKEFPERKKYQAEIARLTYLNIRRNEVAHPDQMSSPSTAQVTLMNICGLIDGVGNIIFATPKMPASQSMRGSNVP